MEKLKGKHDHSLTKILKVLVFAIVLLMPFLVFLPTGLYYGCNRKAENTNYVKTPLYETNEINSVNDLVEGNIYHTNTIDIAITDYNEYNDFFFQLRIVKCDSIIMNQNFLDTRKIDETFIYEYENNKNNEILLGLSNYDLFLSFTNLDAYISTYSNEGEIILNNVDFLIDEGSLQNFKYILNNGLGITITSSNYQVYEYTPSTTITQSMSIAWEEMWDTPLFAWTNNTPFTATTNAFTSVFNISQASGFYNLIAYIITIVCIYLIIDIVIGIATMLTHMIAKQD